MFVCCVASSFSTPTRFKRSQTLRRPFLRHWRRPHAAEVVEATKEDGLHRKLPFFLWHAGEQKQWNNDNGGHIISLQVHKKRTKCFTSAAAFSRISMRMCRQCFNAAQLTAPERGWRPQHRCQMSPMLSRQYNGGRPAFNKPHPVSFLCLCDTGEMLDPRRRRRDATVTTSSIPSQRSDVFRLITDKRWWNNNNTLFLSFKLCISTVKKPHSGVVTSQSFSSCLSRLPRRGREMNQTWLMWKTGILKRPAADKVLGFFNWS